jgi:hypothetical protein
MLLVLCQIPTGIDPRDVVAPWYQYVSIRSNRGYWCLLMQLIVFISHPHAILQREAEAVIWVTAYFIHMVESFNPQD